MLLSFNACCASAVRISWELVFAYLLQDGTMVLLVHGTRDQELDGSCQYAWASLHVHVLQVLDRIAEEIDPEGTGLSYGDFESIASRMPDFINSFKMAV